jgi:uncharacterized protein (TIGR03067 family)
MQVMKTPLILLSLILLCRTASAAEAVSDTKKIEGDWKPISAEMNGQKLPDEVLATITVTFECGKYNTTVGYQKEQGTIKLDGTKKPKTIELTCTDGPNKGKTMPAIYQLDADTLRICSAVAGTNRPTEFKSTVENKASLVVYQRQKP